MENAMIKTENLIKVSDSIEKFNNILYEIIVGNEFEVMEIGEDSEEYLERYEKYQEHLLKFELSFNYSQDMEMPYARLIVKLGYRILADISYTENQFKVIIKQVAKRDVDLSALNIKEVMDIVLSYIDLNKFDMDKKEIVDIVCEHKEYDMAKDIKSLLKVSNVIDDFNYSTGENIFYNIHSNISDNMSCCSMSFRVKKDESTIWLGCQTSYKTKGKFRIWVNNRTGESPSSNKKEIECDLDDIINTIQCLCESSTDNNL